MADLFLLSRSQMHRIEPFFPRSRWLPRVDNRWVISGMVYVMRHGLQRKDAPAGLRRYGPHKTLYDRFIRWAAWACLHASSRYWQEGLERLIG